MVAFKSIIAFIDVCNQAMVRPSLRDVNAEACFKLVALPGLNLGFKILWRTCRAAPGPNLMSEEASNKMFGRFACYFILFHVAFFYNPGS